MIGKSGLWACSFRGVGMGARNPRLISSFSPRENRFSVWAGYKGDDAGKRDAPPESFGRPGLQSMGAESWLVFASGAANAAHPGHGRPTASTRTLRQGPFSSIWVSLQIPHSRRFARRNITWAGAGPGIKPNAGFASTPNTCLKGFGGQHPVHRPGGGHVDRFCMNKRPIAKQSGQVHVLENADDGVAGFGRAPVCRQLQALKRPRWVSRFEVASSRTSTGASWTRARAKTTRCRSPPLSSVTGRPGKGQGVGLGA